MTVPEYKKNLLVMPLSGETEEQAFSKGLAFLESQLPLLTSEWERIRKINRNDVKLLEVLEPFHKDFSHCWLTSSAMTLACFGGVNCQSILELTAQWKSISWSVDSLQFYEELPEELTIFRGGEGPFETITDGYSWSLMRHIAESYASAKSGLLVCAQLKKMDILLLIPEEHEVVPQRSALFNIHLIHLFEQ